MGPPVATAPTTATGWHRPLRPPPHPTDGGGHGPGGPAADNHCCPGRCRRHRHYCHRRRRRRRGRYRRRCRVGTTSRRRCRRRRRRPCRPPRRAPPAPCQGCRSSVATADRKRCTASSHPPPTATATWPSRHTLRTCVWQWWRRQREWPHLHQRCRVVGVEGPTRRGRPPRSLPSQRDGEEEVAAAVTPKTRMVALRVVATAGARVRAQEQRGAVPPWWVDRGHGQRLTGRRPPPPRADPPRWRRTRLASDRRPSTGLVTRDGPAGCRNDGRSMH